MDNYYLQQLLQSELLPDESLLWCGRPNRRAVLHKEDLGSIPFSLIWGGFFIFWEYMAIVGFNKPGGGGGWFFVLWGVPFVAVGQYMIWGRFIYAWWKKARVFYGVTTKRVIVLDQAWGRRTNTAYLDQIPTIQKVLRSDGIGTLRFGNPPPPTRRSRNVTSIHSLDTHGVATFVDIDAAESVYLIVFQARDKLIVRNRRDGQTDS
jgi:hypothetical protein